MDVTRKLSLPQQFLDWVLSPVSNHDHWVQEEETWSSVRQTVRRCSPCGLACGHRIRGHIPYRHGCILFIVAYMFVKSFPGRMGNFPKPFNPHCCHFPWSYCLECCNTLVPFMVSLFLGPILDPRFPMFGSIMAFIAHILAVVGMVGFFEFLVRIQSI
jgi:hypothetical protein